MELSRRNALQAGAAAAGLIALPQVVRGVSAAGPTAVPSLRPAGPPQVGPWRLLAGSLHDHSLDSDGDTAAEPIATWLAAHRRELGIDFATLSDHSDFFPVSGGVVEAPATALGLPPAIGIPPSGLPTLPPLPPCNLKRSAYETGQTSCVSYLPVRDGNALYSTELWKRQGALMAKYSSADFSFIRGFEWTNDQQNHLDVLLSSNWTSRAVTGDGSFSMKPFWTWFDAAPRKDPSGHGLGFGGGDGVGMFNHPGDKGALNWDDYGLDSVAAKRMALIEIHGDQSASGRGNSDAGWYWFALAKGWTVSPVMNWDWHEWTTGDVLRNQTPGGGYGVSGYLPGQRSLVLATDAKRSSIREALLARRTSASETPDLWATLRSGAMWQGSTVTAPPGQNLALTIEAGSGAEALSRVDIISDSGIDAHNYYDGDNASWNSFHSQLTPSFVVRHARFTTSGGRATRKARLDSPPPGSLVSSAALTGTHDTVTINIPVPTTPSPRPDGQHFFYAIVYAGSSATPARCWTGPILTKS